MAGNNVKYIIDLVANDKTLRQQLAKINWEEIIGSKGKGLSDALRSEAKDSADTIKSTLGGLHLDWSSILGEKDLKRLETLAAKVVSSNADKLKGFIKEGDVSGIQSIVDLVSALGNELKALGSSFDVAGLARSMGSFMKILSSVPEKFNELASEPQKVANAFNLAFSDGKWATDVTKDAKEVISVVLDLDKVFSSLGSDTSGFDKQSKKLSQYKKQWEAIAQKKYTIDYELNEGYIDESYEYITADIEDAKDRIDRIQAELNKTPSDSQLQQQLKDEQGSLAKLFLQLNDIENERIRLGKAPKLGVAGETSSQELIRETKNILKQFKDDAKKVTDSLSQIQLDLTLPEYKSFIPKINQFVDDLNKQSDTFHKIQLTTNIIDDALNPIEDKKKRAQKSKNGENPAQDDVVTDSLVEKTDSRFERVEKVITKRQGDILEGTQKWRKDMIEAMSLSSTDLTFDFKGANPGKELYEELEQYFNENPINVQIDTKSIAEQIKSIIGAEGLTIGSGGGVANIDPRAIASAVYAAINSAFTGEKMPEYEYKGNGDSDDDKPEDVPVDDSIEDTVESSKKYVKTLDETTIHIDKVVESLKEFAKISTATKKDKNGNIIPKASQGIIKIRDWLTNFKGIDIAKIASGEIDDAGIRQMLQDAFLTETEDGYASGSAFVDRLKELIEKYKIKSEKGSGKAIESLRLNIEELFKMLEIKQETVSQQQKRYKATEIAQIAISAGQSLNLLNAVRGKLNPRKKLNKITSKNLKNLPTIDAIQKVIDDFTSKGINTEDLESLKIAREALGDKTDEASIEAFKQAAKEFYEKSRGIFDTLNLQFSDFKGTVKLKGRKGSYDISELKDIYSIPKDAVIVDAKVYGYIERKAIDKSIVGSSTMRESSWRKATRQEMRWLSEGSRTFGKADYLSEEPVGFGSSKKSDILDRTIKVAPFRPIEDKSISKKPFDLDKTLDLAQEKIKDAEDKLQKIESKSQRLNERAVEQRASIEREKQALSTVSEERTIIDQKKVRAMLGMQRLKEDAISGVERAIQSNDSLPDVSVAYPEIDKQIKSINDTVAERAQLEEQLYNIEKLTIDEAKKRLKLFEEDEKRLAQLQAIPSDKLTKKQREEVDSLGELINRRAKNKALYKDFIENPDAAKTSLETSIASLKQKEIDDKSILLEWAKAEAAKIPEATAEIEKAAKPILAQFNTYLRNLYEEAIATEAKLGDENLSDEEKNTLIGHLQNVLRFIQETEAEYKGFARTFNGPQSLLRQDRRKKIQSLTKTYIAETPSVVDERKLRLHQAEMDLEGIQDAQRKAETERIQTEGEKKSSEQLILRIEKQKEFNFLKEKELALQAEIATLESEGSDIEEKKKELFDVTSELFKVKNELDKLGGVIKTSDYKDLSEQKIKEHALTKAKQYQEAMIDLTAQKYASESKIARIDTRKADIKKYKLGAGEGLTALQKTKSSLISDFMSSDYVRAQEQALRDKAEAAIAEAESESRAIFYDKVAEIMSFNKIPLTQEEIQRFLSTQLGKKISDDFETELNTNKRNIWAQYDLYKEDLRTKLLKDFKDSFSIDKKGVLSATFKTQDEDGKWVDDIKHETVLQDLLAKLDEEKKDLKEKYKDMDSKIAYAREQQQLAMTYGALSQSDVLNDDIVQQQIQYRQNLIDAQEKLAKEKSKLDALKEAGLDDDNEEVKAQKKVISQINEEIDRYQVLIDNREKLIELRKKEKEDSELSAEEKRILAIERLQKAKDNLVKTDERISQLQKEYDAAKGTEKEMVALKALNDEKKKQEQINDRISKEEKIVGYWTKTTQKEAEKSKSINDNETISTGTGGILGAITSAVKEAVLGAVTNVQIDTSRLATEDTLLAIYTLLGGGSEISDTERAALEEELATINKQLEGEGVRRNKKKKTSSEAPLDDAESTISQFTLPDGSSLEGTKQEYEEYLAALNDHKKSADEIQEDVDEISQFTLPDGVSFEGTKQEYEEYLATIKDDKKSSKSNDKPDILTRKAEIEGKLSASSGGILGVIRDIATENTLKQVLSKLGEIAKKNAMSGKPNSAQDLLEQFRRMLESDAWEGRERVAYMDLATGSMSNAITGDNEAVSAERLRILREAYAGKMDMNAQVHTHANEDDPYFSPEDLKQFGIEFANGITKQILLSKNNMTVLDMADVKDIDDLLDALSKTEQNFEALATTADKFGAKYVSKAFDTLTPQSLVKMLGIKGIESKLSETETRESARMGVAEEDAKESAKMLQESTGRAIKTTVQRTGVELEKLIEKTDVKGNKTWSSEISNNVQKAMEATHKMVADQNLGSVFGEGTDATKTLTEYETHYSTLLDLITRFKSASEEEREGLQSDINDLLPKFNEAEQKLLSLIARKEKFMGDKDAVATFSQEQIDVAGDSLKAFATDRYANGLLAQENVAFNGISETQNGKRLLVDVLKDGTIKQYALEVDSATGQVREFLMAENALANAFQNVNKAMKQNAYVLADVAIGNTPEELSAWMGSASAPQLNAYKQAFEEMQNYTVQLWNSNESPTQQQLDYLMQLSERVIVLGKDLQKTSGIFKNFWAQNPESVFSIGFHEGDTVRDAMERYAQTNAAASSSKYDFVSFDNDTLTYKLTDVEGKIRNVTIAWNELYKVVKIDSDKYSSALDPLVKKIEEYKQIIADAKANSYLLDNDDTKFKEALQDISALEQKVKDGTASFEELEAARRKAIGIGADVNKLANKNAKLYIGTNEINSAKRQRDKILGTTDASLKPEEQPSMLKQYIAAYDSLIAKHQEYAKQNQLNNPKIQEELRQQAAYVQKLGKQYMAAANEAETLKGNVYNSGAMGGIKQVSTEEFENMEAAMRAYAKEVLGADLETVKFNSTTQTMTGVFRQNNRVVSDMVVKYNDATEAFYLYQKQERESLSGFPALVHGIKEKMKAIMQYVASITSIYRIWGTLKQGITYVKEIDSALTELKKVTDETEETYRKFLKTAAKTADKVGSTIKEVVSSTADWARLGYSLEDAARLAENTSILLNVSEFQSIDDATKALTSTLQAFSYTAKDSLKVVDVLNEVGKLVAHDNYIG